MNLQKLFEMQAELDERIIQQHPELRGQNNLDWKLLALQVELGECANEWRGFKKWSNDQEPRTRKYLTNYTEQDSHLGVGAQWVNPLLEEYVDCLHFILSIGLELGLAIEDLTTHKIGHANITRVFTDLMMTTGTLIYPEGDKEQNYKILFIRFIQLGELLGFTWEEVEQAYFAKNKTNHERQLKGY